jgi:hypothetical protein
VWDFDWAYGDDLRGSEPLVSGYEEGWFKDLYHSAAFQACLEDIFRQIHDEIYDTYRDEWFEEQKSYLSASYYMNTVRWQRIDDKTSALAELDTAVDMLQTYFEERIELLDAVFCSEQVYCKVNFVYAGGKDFAHTYVKAGETIPEEVVEHLRSVYGCVPLEMADGESIDWTTYRVLQDADIECGAEEEQLE